MSLNLKSDIENASPEELKQIKTWLFKESIRIQNEKEQLDQQVKDFCWKNRQLESEKILFHHKWEILESAYRDLHEEKKKFELEKQQLIGKRHETAGRNSYESSAAGIFFRGVNNPLALKKRYKDLIKIFHPDNMAGDHDTVQLINHEYSVLKEVY